MELLRVSGIVPPSPSLSFTSLLYGWSSSSSIDFLLLRPEFLHGASATCHLAFFLLLSVLWLRSRRGTGRPRPEYRNHTGAAAAALSLHRVALFGCLGLGLFHFIFTCAVDYLWFISGRWSDARLATQLDLASRAFSWLVLSAYLYFDFSPSREGRFPTFLRVWWALFLVIACYFLGADLLYSLGHHRALSLWVLDSVSFLFGLLLNFAGCFGKRIEKEGEAPPLREPLLNGNNELTAADEPAAPGDGAGAIKSPYSSSSFFSILTFSWMNSLISTGYRKTLNLEDVPLLPESDSVAVIFPLFKAKLEECAAATAAAGGSAISISDTSSRSIQGIGSLTLVKALFLSEWGQVLLSGVFALVYAAASYVGPYLITFFVDYLNGRSRFPNEGYVLVLAFVIAKIVECLSQRHWFFRIQQVGIRMRATLVAMIYEKGLLLSNSSRQSSSSGEVVNLMSVDAERIVMFSVFIHELLLVPVQVSLALLVLYNNLGLAALPAIAATFAVMLANIPFASLEEKFQENLMEAKDERMKATSEILRNMKILKLQAWEMKFLSKIMALRESEARWLKKYVYTSAMTTFVFWGSPTFVAVVTFGSCILMGIPLESGKVLSALATFSVLQEPIYSLPSIISTVIQTKVSFERISSFLNLEVLQQDVVDRLPRNDSDVAVEVTNGSFSWDTSSENPTLKDLNFQILHGMKVAVCGVVGSGKSSLLSCLLGEVPKISGTVKLCGKTAYVSQSPWIQGGKIQDNIVFGQKMEREKYKQILEACSLVKDLEALPLGDQTIIGERGINLSGGQKQRIQIARALYQDADIFLFDDPFSAVDAHTGTHLFKECLFGFLSSKTVICVTHQIEFLPACDLILVMKNGKITQAGKYNDIYDSGEDFMELVGAHRRAFASFSSAQCSAENLNKTPNDGRHDVGVEPRSRDAHKEEESDGQDEEDSEKFMQEGGQLVQDEEREKGRVSSSVYWEYLTASYKGALVPLILLGHIIFLVLQICSNYWMVWAAPVSKDVKPPVSALVLIYVYVALAFGSSIFVLVRSLLVATAGYKTATTLFNKMHMCIFRAPMLFFDSTPSGRILNRSSTNQSEVDTTIPQQIWSFAFSMIQLLGIIVVMSQVAWQVFLIFIPVIAICIWYQQYYISTARELARLIGVCESPVIQHFSESMSGLTTIRSFNQESKFHETNLRLNDAFSQPMFYNAAAMEWFCFRLDMLSSMTFALSLVFLISLPQGIINPGLAGLAVTYGLSLNMLQAEVIWDLCNVENEMVSVERILQYTCIPSEPPLSVDSNIPDSSWPSQGEVDIHHLQVRYSPQMPFILKGLSCTFCAGKKIGIVGRTGSGKSTLIQTIFRIVDPTAGQIFIDGIDISYIGLHDLRSRLSIIPQEPTMFEGTIRSNLDPLEEYTDGQIWEALDICHLGEEVRKKKEKLDSAVTENGENWSMGQRQLVCLGRVLLKRSKILVLDEATASVDTATDSLIQKTLREQFSESTVITIAHRITSVVDSDMVMVLDNGLFTEYGPPKELLKNKTSLFAKLAFEYNQRSDSIF